MQENKIGFFSEHSVYIPIFHRFLYMIYWPKISVFIHPSIAWSHIISCIKVGIKKNYSPRPTRWWKPRDPIRICLRVVLACDRQTDGQRRLYLRSNTAERDNKLSLKPRVFMSLQATQRRHNVCTMSRCVSRAHMDSPALCRHQMTAGFISSLILLYSNQNHTKIHA